jgi:hypothetical protein
MPEDFVVLSVECPEGERFAIVRTEDVLRSSAIGVHSVTDRAPKDWEALVEQWLRSLGLLMTEDAVRARLVEMGIAGSAVDEHITRSRKVRRLNKGGSWETVSTVGYRNVEGQVVVTKTTHTGSEPDQLVFVMRCSVCGHEYGSNGCDIPRRCCPNCQDGPPGEPYR